MWRGLLCPHQMCDAEALLLPQFLDVNDVTRRVIRDGIARFFLTLCQFVGSRHDFPESEAQEIHSRMRPRPPGTRLVAHFDQIGIFGLSIL